VTAQREIATRMRVQIPVSKSVSRHSMRHPLRHSIAAVRHPKRQRIAIGDIKMPTLPPTLTRHEVATLLGKSDRSVLRLDETGVLHPMRDSAGNVTYARAEVEALLKARGITPSDAQAAAPVPLSDGALTAKVFRDLRGGKLLLDTMIDHELTPEEGDRMLAAYARASDAIIVSGPERERLRKIAPDVKTSALLLDVVAELARGHHELKAFVFTCAKCGKPVQARASHHWAYLARQGTFDKWRHDECYAKRQESE